MLSIEGRQTGTSYWHLDPQTDYDHQDTTQRVVGVLEDDHSLVQDSTEVAPVHHDPKESPVHLELYRDDSQNQEGK